MKIRVSGSLEPHCFVKDGWSDLAFVQMLNPGSIMELVDGRYYRVVSGSYNYTVLKPLISSVEHHWLGEVEPELWESIFLCTTTNEN